MKNVICIGFGLLLGMQSVAASELRTASGKVTVSIRPLRGPVCRRLTVLSSISGGTFRALSIEGTKWWYRTSDPRARRMLKLPDQFHPLTALTNKPLSAWASNGELMVVANYPYCMVYTPSTLP